MTAEVDGLIERLGNLLAADSTDKCLIRVTNGDVRAAIYGLRRLQRKLQEQQRLVEAFPRLSQFFDKYALGSKTKPSCLVCGRDDYGSLAIQHLELPGIVVCARCVPAQWQRPTDSKPPDYGRLDWLDEDAPAAIKEK